MMHGVSKAVEPGSPDMYNFGSDVYAAVGVCGGYKLGNER